MNQFFDFKRFNLLVLKHWAVNKKRYSLSVLALIGLLILWFVFALIIGDDKLMSADFQQMTFYFGLFVLGTFYASQYYHDLGSKPKGSNFLLVPASTFSFSFWMSEFSATKCSIVVFTNCCMFSTSLSIDICAFTASVFSKRNSCCCIYSYLVITW